MLPSIYLLLNIDFFFVSTCLIYLSFLLLFPFILLLLKSSLKLSAPWFIAVVNEILEL